MGNLCGKESSDPFAQPGRIPSGPQAPPNSRIASLPQKVGGPPRTLGSAPPGARTVSQASHTPEDARRKAAEAAEARANAASKPRGKLASQLREQKKQTRNAILEASNREELGARAADEVAEARAYN